MVEVNVESHKKGVVIGFEKLQLKCAIHIMSYLYVDA